MAKYPDHSNREGYTVYGTVTSVEEHTVEDARTAKRPHKSVPKIEKRNEVKLPRRKGLITVLVTILCFSVTLIAADLLSGRGGFASYAALFKNEKKAENVSYYLVYATHSTDAGISYKNASAIRAEGGAGYVMKYGEEHYIILNAYADKSDAEKVKSRQATYGIIELSMPAFRTDKKIALIAAEKSKELYRESYEVLYECANALARKELTEEELKKQTIRQSQRISTVESVYRESVRGSEEGIAIDYAVLLAEMRSAFENLSEQSDYLLADTRYYSVMILHGYYLFANKYFSAS